jgi:hypothetical protein
MKSIFDRVELLESEKSVPQQLTILSTSIDVNIESSKTLSITKRTNSGI